MVAEQHTETTVCAEYAYCLSNSDTDVIKEKLKTVYEKLSSLHKGIGTCIYMYMCFCCKIFFCIWL